jgi:hypothetical protein
MWSIFVNWDLYFLKRTNPAVCGNIEFSQLHGSFSKYHYTKYIKNFYQLTCRKAFNATAVYILAGRTFKNLASHAQPSFGPWMFGTPCTSVCKVTSDLGQLPLIMYEEVKMRAKTLILNENGQAVILIIQGKLFFYY